MLSGRSPETFPREARIHRHDRLLLPILSGVIPRYESLSWKESSRRSGVLVRNQPIALVPTHAAGPARQPFASLIKRFLVRSE